MSWFDNEIRNSYYFRPYMIALCLTVLGYSLYTGIVVFFTTMLWKNKIFSSICMFGVGAYLFLYIISLINGSKIIESISTNDGLVEIVTSMRRKKNYNYRELVKVRVNSFKWFLGVAPILFRDNKSYISIYFKNGKNYVVSPDMERIDELKDVLTEIIENNNAKTID